MRLAAAVALTGCVAVTDDPVVPEATETTFSLVTQGAAVQSGTTTNTANGTQTVTISSVDPQKAFLLFGTRHNNDRPVGSTVRGRIANATTLEFVRVTDEVSPTPIPIRWYVVEYATGVRVQRGQVAQTATTIDVTLPTAVGSLAQAFVTFSKTADATDVGWNDDDAVVVDLTAPNNLQVRTLNATATHIIWWQVVEFTDPSWVTVQRGSTTMAAAATSASATLTAVDPARTFVLTSFQTADGGADMGARALTAQLTNATTITFDREVSGALLDEIHWQAVELKEGSRVQRGLATLASGDGSEDVTIAAVDTARATAFTSVESSGGLNLGRTSFATDDIPGVAAVTAQVANATTVSLTRANTAAGASFSWFAVEWGPTCGNGVLEGDEVCDGNPCCEAGGCAVASAGTECRPSIAACDPAEECNGTSADCPPDTFLCDGPAPADARVNGPDGGGGGGSDSGVPNGGDGGGGGLNDPEKTSALAWNCRVGRGGRSPGVALLLVAIGLLWVRRARMPGAEGCRSRSDSSGSAREPAAPTRSSTPSSS